jgi:hypothetical protein
MQAALEASFNKSQLAAIQAAVVNPVTLIQGPVRSCLKRAIYRLIYH